MHLNCYKVLSVCVFADCFSCTLCVRLQQHRPGFCFFFCVIKHKKKKKKNRNWNKRNCKQYAPEIIINFWAAKFSSSFTTLFTNKFHFYCFWFKICACKQVLCRHRVIGMVFSALLALTLTNIDPNGCNICRWWRKIDMQINFYWILFSFYCIVNSNAIITFTFWVCFQLNSFLNWTFMEMVNDKRIFA